MGLLLVGCLAAGPTATTAPSAAVGVIITSAAGDTLAFEPAEVAVPDGGPVLVTFQNGSSLAHNLVFTAGMSGATRAIVEPGTSDQLVLVPAAPGAYRFVCTIHEGMAGTLIVQATSSGDVGAVDPRT